MPIYVSRWLSLGAPSDAAVYHEVSARSDHAGQRFFSWIAGFSIPMVEGLGEGIGRVDSHCPRSTRSIRSTITVVELCRSRHVECYRAQIAGFHPQHAIDE